MSCKCLCFSVDCNDTLSFVRRYSSRRRNKKIVISLVGLDNAGKTCAARQLSREPAENTIPTVGFNVITLRHKGHPVIVYDLGGGPQIRAIWTSYFVDVHGIMFVIDASDSSRIDESRKVLEELLSHDKVAGKPLLVIANKQDKEGALDEIDIVEKLNLECLVNQQKCPTMVETCSAAGAPVGRNAKLDPGLHHGYRWLLRRIINDYDKLNGRVEQDSREQRAINEAARQEWLRKQDTEEQKVDDLSSEFEENPFKSIDSVVKVNENNYKAPRERLANGHVIHVRSISPSASDNSPDSSSHTVDNSSHVYIPLHSPVHQRGGDGDHTQVFIPLHSPPHERQTSLAESHVVVVSQPMPGDVVSAVKEQLEWKMQKQKQKKLLRRTNRTAPASAASSESERTLPPLRTPHQCSWARAGSAKSLPSEGWGLSLALEEVEPPPFDRNGSPELETVKSPRTIITSNSDDDNDDDDVVICTSFTR